MDGTSIQPFGSARTDLHGQSHQDSGRKELPEEGYVLVKQGLLEEFRQKYGEEYVLDTVYTSNRRSCDVRDIIHILHFTKEKAIGNAETEERF